MNLPGHALSVVLFLLITANLALIAVLKPMGDRLKASGEEVGDKRTGIFHFELAMNTKNAERIMQIWREAKLETVARNSIWLDFAFLLAYPLVLALFSWMIAASSSGVFAQFGVAIGYLVLACAPLDAIENVGMLRMLDHGADDKTVQVTTVCSAIKWLLAVIAVLYVVLGIGQKFLIIIAAI